MGQISPNQSNQYGEASGYSGDESEAPSTIAARLKEGKRKKLAIRRNRQKGESNSKTAHRQGEKKLVGMVIYTPATHQHSERTSGGGDSCTSTDLTFSESDRRCKGDDPTILSAGNNRVLGRKKRHSCRCSSTTTALTTRFGKSLDLTSNDDDLTPPTTPRWEENTASSKHSRLKPFMIQEHTHQERTQVQRLPISETQHIFTPRHAPSTAKEHPLTSSELAARSLRRKAFREACDAFERRYRLAPDDPRVLERMRSPSPSSEYVEHKSFMKVQPPFNTWDEEEV